MTVRAWPFLIGRVRGAGHRVVVAPDFLLADSEHTVLEAVSRGPDTADGEAVCDLILGGRLAVVSRVFEAHATDCDLPGHDVNGDGVLRDRANRPIRLTEGLVLAAEPGSPPHVTTDDLARAHRAVVPAYREFWFQENDFQPLPSVALPDEPPAAEAKPLVLRASGPISGPELGRELDPPTRGHRGPAGHRRGARSAVGLATAVLAAVVIVIAVLATRSKTPTVPPRTPICVATAPACLLTPASTSANRRSRIGN